MELDATNIDHDLQEDYVLLNLDAVVGQVDIPPGAGYSKTSLDHWGQIEAVEFKTFFSCSVISSYLSCFIKSLAKVSPKVQQTSAIDQPTQLRRIGEYEETIGTCLIFSENEKTPLVHEETGTSEANLFKGACIIDPNQGPSKQIEPVTALNKILKFRLMLEADVQAMAEKSPDLIVQEDQFYES